MNLQDLYEKHQKDIDGYTALKDKVWQKIIDKYEGIALSFENEVLPKEYAEEMAKEKDDFNNIWSIPNGTKYKNIILQHEQQLDAVNDFIQPTKGQDKTIINDNVVDAKQRSFMDKLASSKVLREEQEKANDIEPNINSKSKYEQNKDDMDLEID
jgi:hypothetical protein